MFSVPSNACRGMAVWLALVARLGSCGRPRSLRLTATGIEERATTATIGDRAKYAILERPGGSQGRAEGEVRTHEPLTASRRDNPIGHGGMAAPAAIPPAPRRGQGGQGGSAPLIDWIARPGTATTYSAM